MKSLYDLFEYREVKSTDLFAALEVIGFCLDIGVRYRAGEKICFLRKSRKYSFTVVGEMFKRSMRDRMKNGCYPFIDEASQTFERRLK